QISHVADGAADYEAPMGETEEAVARIWQGVLGRKRIGRNDNFFVSGGDSLLISQVIARMWKEIPGAARLEWGEMMKAILKTPTISAISQTLTTQAEEPQSSHTLQWLVGNGNEDANNDAIGELTVLIHAGSGSMSPYKELLKYLLHQNKGNHKVLGITVWDRAVYIDKPAETLFRQLGREYASSLLALNANSYKIIGHCVGGLISLEIAAILEQRGKHVELVMISSNLIADQSKDKSQYLNLCEDVFLERVYGQLIGADIKKAGYTADDGELKAAICSVRENNGGVFSLDKFDCAAPQFALVKDEIRRHQQNTHDDRLKRLYNEVVRKEGGTFSASPEQALDAVYRIFRHNFLAAVHYSPVEFRGKAVVLKCENETNNFFVNIMDAFSDDYNVWKPFLADMQFATIHGDHLSCLEKPEILRNIGRILGR
ncbi:MAG: thioesterase domain-containing protein, partial [Lachnospiraceae bacterium]